MKSFLQYINEDKYYSFVEELANQIIQDLKNSTKRGEYSLIKEYEFMQPVTFDLKVYARWDNNPDLTQDQHFNELEWEVHNFTRLGYSINAVTKFNDSEFQIPEIDLFIIINSDDNSVYNLLDSRLTGIIAHELRHVRQIGMNREPFMGRVSTSQERATSQQNYGYFLLPEEMDAMIEDKYIQSVEENKPIDDVISAYLYPFVKDGFMNSQDFKKVFIQWIIRAIELFPNANFSKKAEKIINNI